MAIIADKVSFAKTQMSAFLTMARIKEGELDGIDVRPEMSAETCRELAAKWGEEVERWENVQNN